MRKMKTEFLFNILLLLSVVVMLTLVFLISGNIDKIWPVFYKSAIFVFLCIFVFLLVRIYFAEKEIFGLYEKRDEAIREIENQPISLRVMDGQIRQEELFYQGKISAIKRKRRYDLDKIPFLKN